MAASPAAIPGVPSPAGSLALQLPRQLFHQRRRALEGTGHARDLGIGVAPLPLLDRLADSGHRLDAVAGVEAGRVEQVLVPRATAQSLGRGQGALGLDEPPVHGPKANAV